MSLVPASWRLIRDDRRPGYANMARDQALLDFADRDGLAVLRLYGWSPHCLSFGRNEPALRRYDRDQIAAQGLDLVRRPTGGRAVWHARELTYAVVAPIEIFGGLRQAYGIIHRMLAAAVVRLGGRAELAPPTSRTAGLDAGACFASPAGGEVMIAGRKVIGSAQLQQGTALLQHGSLLIEDDQSAVHAVTRGQPPASQDTPLATLLDRPVSLAEVSEAVIGAAHDWPGSWSPWEDDQQLAALAATYEPGFQSDDWTWRR